MASDTEISNMAISLLGQGAEIASLESERSEEASACRRFFDLARDEVLEDFPWPFATAIEPLGLVTDSEDDDHPTDEWGYSYRYPSDCLSVRRILSGNRTDHRQSRVSYKIVQDEAGRLIFTDMPLASIEYTKREDDTSKYPAKFVVALAYKLASYIAPRVTGGDPYSMGDKLLQKYQMVLSDSVAASFNEEQPDQEPASEFERARDS